MDHQVIHFIERFLPRRRSVGTLGRTFGERSAAEKNSRKNTQNTQKRPGLSLLDRGSPNPHGAEGDNPCEPDTQDPPDAPQIFTTAMIPSPDRGSSGPHTAVGGPPRCGFGDPRSPEGAPDRERLTE